MTTLGDELPREIFRVEKLVKLYEATPGGKLAASFMKKDIAEARDAMSKSDVIRMIQIYKALKDWKE